MRGVVYNCGPCPYLPDREFHAFHPKPNPPTDIPYRLLMDHRFRRSGDQLYMPMCPGCHACKPIRIDIERFKARDDQRRCLKRNSDLTVTWHPRGRDAERDQLFCRYQMTIHGKPPDDEGLDFLIEDGGITGGELHAHNSDGQLIAVSVVDVFDDALSSVYCYYDPSQSRRSLGTFMILSEIAHCQAQKYRWLYLGFLVHGCRKMVYKARFLPHDVLDEDRWQRSE